MQQTALVTAVGSTTGQSVIKGLRAGCPGLRVLGIDTHPRFSIAGSRMVDSFVTAPSATHPDYIKVLRELCVRENVAAIFPIVDAELMVLAQHAESFENWGVRLWLLPMASVAMCDDKWLTSQFFTRCKVHAPQTWEPEGLDIRSLAYPLVVKPRVGVSGRGVVVVHDEAHLLAALDVTDRPIVQTYLNGPEYTIDMLADWQGKVIAAVPRERLEIRAGICYRGATVRAPKLVEQCHNMARAMQLRGPANFQCRKVGEDYYFFEINARFSGSLPLTIEAGVNGPAMLWDATLGAELLPASYEAEVYMTRYWQEAFSHGIPTQAAL